MSIDKGYSQYRENTIFTSTPEELTMMLYNGIIRFIMQAQLAIEEKNYEKTNNSIIRVQDIIEELQSALDTKFEISQNLMQLYDYMHRRLLDANIGKDKEILEEVLGLAKVLRDTWAQAMKLAKGQGNVQTVAK